MRGRKGTRVGTIVRSDTPGHIYAAICRKQGFVKLGFSTDVKTRIWRLGHWYPGMKLLAVVPGTLADEQRIHRALKPYRRPPQDDALDRKRELYATSSEFFVALAEMFGDALQLRVSS